MPACRRHPWAQVSDPGRNGRFGDLPARLSPRRGPLPYPRSPAGPEGFMRLLAAFTLALLLPAARADEVADLKDRVLKAAARDPADLQKLKRFTLTARGKSFLGPEPVDGTFTLTAEYPGKLRVSWVFGTVPGSPT